MIDTRGDAIATREKIPIIWLSIAFCFAEDGDCPKGARSDLGQDCGRLVDLCRDFQGFTQ